MKRIIPVMTIIVLILSLFAVPISAAAIPEDEIIQLLPIVHEQFIVPEYVTPDPVDFEFSYYEFDLEQDVNLFDPMLNFWDQYGDHFPEGFEWYIFIDGVRYDPIGFVDGEPIFGNPELIYGHELRDELYEHHGGWPSHISFNYEYDSSLPFYLDFNSFNFKVDSSLADGFTIAVYLAASPSIESIDYEDYVSGTTLSDDGAFATVSLPADWAASHIRLSGERAGEGIIYYGSDFSYDFTGVIGLDNHIQTYPFGWFFPTEKYYYSGKALYAGNIPYGSTLSFTFTLRASCSDSWLYEPEDQEFKFRVAHVAEPGVTAYIEDGTYKVLQMTQDNGEFVMKVQCSYTKNALQNEAEYLAFCCGFDLAIAESESAVMDFSLDDVKLEISVSALVASLMESQKSNKLLTEVKEQLAEQGKTLDEILTGSSGMQDTADKITGDISNKVEQGNQLMDALDSVQRPNVGGAVSLPSNITTGTATNFNTVVAHLWNNDLIYQMMSLAGMVMLASYILFGKKV